MDKKQSSHIYAHLTKAHPDKVKKKWQDYFRFEVKQMHRSAFNRQLSEALEIKNSKAVIMNLKEEYVRCLIPDIPLRDRGWIEGGPQRPETKTDDTPRLKKVVLTDVDKSKDTKKSTRRERMTTTIFTRVKRKREGRKK